MFLIESGWCDIDSCLIVVNPGLILSDWEGAICLAQRQKLYNNNHPQSFHRVCEHSENPLST